MGLPSYKGLVDEVYLRLKEIMDSNEEKAYKTGYYDRVFSLLENRLSNPSLVRKTVKEILIIDPSSKKLKTHDALLTLSRNKKGDYRIVTTNFDQGFNLVGRSDLQIDAAPKLPVPKPHRWNSLVHIHGLLDVTDEEGKTLVLSSADFGAAYLTERWASKFVSELFRRYTVLFVGYSVEDPVIRYMIDALAADKRQGDEQANNAYVLAPSTPKKFKKSEKDWRTKGVLPILYNQRSMPIRILHTKFLKT